MWLCRRTCGVGACTARYCGGGQVVFPIGVVLSLVGVLVLSLKEIGNAELRVDIEELLMEEGLL